MLQQDKTYVILNGRYSYARSQLVNRELDFFFFHYLLLLRYRKIPYGLYIGYKYNLLLGYHICYWNTINVIGIQ